MREITELTEEQAIEIAQEHNLEIEVRELMLEGFTPEEALEEWDILPDEYNPEYSEEEWED